MCGEILDFEKEKRFKQLLDTPEDHKGMTAEEVIHKEFGKEYRRKMSNGKTIEEVLKKALEEDPLLRKLWDMECAEF